MGRISQGWRGPFSIRSTPATWLVVGGRVRRTVRVLLILEPRRCRRLRPETGGHLQHDTASITALQPAGMSEQSIQLYPGPYPLLQHGSDLSDNLP
jgi:hypothetical protein